ncbi:MAG: hypothetical protein K1X55_06170 [Chitinophagales bacterium]|nr:hypothetical protein [Chitinophagales bacterium]
MKKIFLVCIIGLLFSSCVHDPIAGEPIIPKVLEPRDTSKVYFVNDLLPILRSSCAIPGCHDAATPAANINLTSYESILASKVGGEPILVPGKPLQSKLYRATRGLDILVAMPTPFNFQITDKDKNMIAKWIAQGALNNECEYICDEGEITYFGTIRPLIDKYCTGCHYGLYPSDDILLETHGQVAELALNGKLYNALLGQNGVARMPQLAAMPDCEIAQIKEWIDAGAPRN